MYIIGKKPELGYKISHSQVWNQSGNLTPADYSRATNQARESHLSNMQNQTLIRTHRLDVGYIDLPSLTCNHKVISLHDAQNMTCNKANG